MNAFKLEDWLPQEPAMGPPLPRFLEILWPWYKPPVAVTEATLYGWVKDKATGEPVPNSRIQIGPAWDDWPWEGYSDAEGYYEIANIPVSEAIHKVDNIPWFSLRYTAPPELQNKYPGLGSFVLLPAGERTRYDWNLLARY